jgi:hypothetical protein
MRQFPHAGIDPTSSSRNQVEEIAWLCDKCVAAEADWMSGLKPWVTLADIRERRDDGFPRIGIPIVDLQQVLQLVENSDCVVDKRVMGLAVYSDGHVTIRTGEILAPLFGSGDFLLFRKDAGDWVLVESSRWAS